MNVSRLPPERIVAMAEDLVEGGQEADVLVVARKLLASAERRRRTHPAAADDRAALARAMLAALRRRGVRDGHLRVVAACLNEEEKQSRPR